MTKQAIDWSVCEAVESVPGRLSGVPVLKGTRLQAQSVVDNHEDGLTPAEIADLFDVREEQVRAVLDHAAGQQRAKAKRRRGLSPVGS